MKWLLLSALPETLPRAGSMWISSHPCLAPCEVHDPWKASNDYSLWNELHSPESKELGLGSAITSFAKLWFLGFSFPVYRSRPSSHMTLKALPGFQDFLSTAIGSDPPPPVWGPILVNSSPGLDFIMGPGVCNFSWIDLGATDVRASGT